MVDIRRATPADAATIAAIYNHAVENSTAIWNDITVNAQSRAEWLVTRQADGFPVLVSTNDMDTVTGFASYGPFRPHDGYRHTVELSLYVDTIHRGQGIGRALLKALIEHAQADQVHVMVGAIEASNAASIALHKSLGFHHTGTLPQVGTKFGRWLDLAFLTRVMSPEKSNT